MKDRKYEDAPVCEDAFGPDDPDLCDEEDAYDFRFVEKVRLKELINGHQFAGEAVLDNGDRAYFVFLLLGEDDGYLLDVQYHGKDTERYYFDEDLEEDMKVAILEEIYENNGCDRLKIEAEIVNEAVSPFNGNRFVTAMIGESQLRCEYNLHRHYYKLVLQTEDRFDIYHPYEPLDADFLAGNEALFRKLTAAERGEKGSRRKK